MAVKNTRARIYHCAFDRMCEILRSSDFSKCIDADFIEEAILSDGVEFRYVRKTDITRYGRNFFIKVKKTEDNATHVAVTTQSRKVTVLFDTAWKKEAERIFSLMDALLRAQG